jgi:hypothetical protein
MIGKRCEVKNSDGDAIFIWTLVYRDPFEGFRQFISLSCSCS